MLTVKWIYEYCYPLLNKHGITYSLWANGFLKTLEAALIAIRTYEWWLWKRQHFAEQITDMNLWTYRWYIRHQTTEPIYKVDRFRAGKADVIDQYLSFCDCPEDTPDDCVCSQTALADICNLCTPIKMTEILPHTKICKWNYKIAASDIVWMWGEWGDVLHILPDPIPAKMFVTYYRLAPEITSWNQHVNIPRHFINAIKYAIMMDIYVNKGTGGETLLPYFEQKFDKVMLSLKKTDTVLGKSFVRWQNDQWETYPFYWDKNSN